MEKATALVLRTTDWSETSRIATLWTRELGKVRVVAKGGRRLRSRFDNALDLLTLCTIVLIRKSSGSLDLLTEAQVIEGFPGLRGDLGALYAGYYLAELLAEGSQDYDPHPVLFDEALAALRELGGTVSPGEKLHPGQRIARFERVWQEELGYQPVLEVCAACTGELSPQRLAFGFAAGGVLCPRCQPEHRERRSLSRNCWLALRLLSGPENGWRRPWDERVRKEVRQVHSQYVSWLLGKRPRLLAYLT
jgi:DNA repair protein RecO (recombination protein O)